ncbi:hypothetical protein Dimus_008961 [Dionaea muscipula]
MDQGGVDEEIVPCESINGVDASRFASSSPPQPDYNSKAVQDALRRLASIDLIELCNEAKVEHCRATRDLRSCGRLVESVLNSCGHASLCGECSRQCDICPICRIPIPRSGNKLRRRLYRECVEAGLIPRTTPENRLQEKDNDEPQITADVQRLYSLFDVSMENNLCCLVCQYVTNVCMNESAVSSDPIIAFLLDDAVVKNWCRRTFKYITRELREIYKLEIDEMKKMLNSFPKYSTMLAGLSNVLEVLELSFKDTHSANVDDLHHLQEAILKTKQHMEMMMWCIRHEFLENVRSRHRDLSSWRSLVRERKSAAIQRAWPDFVDNTMESTGQDNFTLFIEDALLNLQVEKRSEQEKMVELEIVSLLRDGGLSLFRAKIEGLAGLYPFEYLRDAVDALFLYGSSDMVIAKQAIFLYYVFDRQWTIPDEEWRPVLDDFAATFGVSRHSLLESFTFYLLDDHSEQALQEACRFLPEISGPDSHPKIAKVLLERQAPEAAIMFLRWCGHHGGSDLISLGEAVTAVRVRVECGLLTEAFMYQRTICTKVKGMKVKPQPVNLSDSLKSDLKSWMDWMDVLVTEICCLCIRRNLVDRMIELPWNCDEEKHLHRCLLDCALGNPSISVGSLLVVYYLQRYRYADAYLVDRKVKTAEEDFMSKNDECDEILRKMRSTSQWRTGLVSKCVELLPEVQQQQLKAIKSSEGTSLLYNEVETAKEDDIPDAQGAAGVSLSVPSPSHSSLLQTDHEFSFITPSGVLKQPGPDLTSPSFPYGKLSAKVQSSSKTQFGAINDFKFFDNLTSGGHKLYPVDASAAKKISRISSRVFPNDLQDTPLDDTSPIVEQNGLYGKLPKITPPNSRRVMAKPVKMPVNNHGLIENSRERYTTASSKRRSSIELDQPCSAASVDEMEISWSHEQRAAATVSDDNSKGWLRWRSDDTSDEDKQQSPDRIRSRKFVIASRKGRLSRR